MQVLEDGLVSGRGFAESDAYMINGQPGDLYNCSKESERPWAAMSNFTKKILPPSSSRETKVFPFSCETENRLSDAHCKHWRVLLTKLFKQKPIESPNNFSLHLLSFSSDKLHDPPSVPTCG